MKKRDERDKAFSVTAYLYLLDVFDLVCYFGLKKKSNRMK